VLVIVSGLPGTGKTAVAAGLAARSRAVHVSIDPIEDALLGSGLPATRETGVAAYEAARAVAEQDLAFVVLVLDDLVEHRRRLETRRRDLAHLPEPSWDEVMARANAYAPWSDGECMRLDARRSVDELVMELAGRLAGR